MHSECLKKNIKDESLKDLKTLNQSFFLIYKQGQLKC